ncbi:trichohyalin-like isoform X2 [Scomber scombrus]|uniref:trichohyalin-like isoform X2 n=1 Tax=Scomber scombrus TaxID=13677 RepID=UPI002DDB4393|nr:trichohyalin-like isoform X2 [Scomber scombrus]
MKEEEEDQSISERGELLDFNQNQDLDLDFNQNQNLDLDPEHHTNNLVRREESPSAATDTQRPSSNKDKSARHRARVNANAVLRANYLARRRESYQRRKRQGKITNKPAAELSNEQQKMLREKWREYQRNYRAKKRKEEMLQEDQSISQREDLLDFTDQDYYKIIMEENQDLEQHTDILVIKREDSDSATSDTQRPLSNKEKVARHRARVNANAVLRANYLARRRESYQRRKRQGKITNKPAAELSKDQQKMLREKWRENKRNHRAKKREEEMLQEDQSISQREDLLDFTDQDYYKIIMEDNQDLEQHTDILVIKREDSDSATSDTQEIEDSGSYSTYTVDGSNSPPCWFPLDIKQEEEEEEEQSISQRGDLLDPEHHTDNPVIKIEESDSATTDTQWSPDIKQEEEEQSISQSGDLLDFNQNQNQTLEHHIDITVKEESDSPSSITDKQRPLSSKEKVARHRARVNANAAARANYLTQRRESYQRRKREGKITNTPVAELSKKQQKKMREKWKEYQRNYRARKRNNIGIQQFNFFKDQPSSVEYCYRISEEVVAKYDESVPTSHEWYQVTSEDLVSARAAETLPSTSTSCQQVHPDQIWQYQVGKEVEAGWEEHLHLNSTT